MLRAAFLYELAVPVFAVLFILFYKRITKYNFLFFLLSYIYIIFLIGNRTFPIIIQWEIISNKAYTQYNCNIIPFKNLYIDLVYNSSNAFETIKYYVITALRQIILLIPAGFLISARFRKKKTRIAAIFITGISIELLKLVVGLATRAPGYKEISTDNVIFYIIGGFAGMGLFILLFSIIKKYSAQSKFMGRLYEIVLSLSEKKSREPEAE